MNESEKRTAAEQLARNRAVKGFAFKLLPIDEADAIRDFLKGGPCPAGYRKAYDRARRHLFLGPKDWYEAFADAAIGLIGDAWDHGMGDMTPEQEDYCLRAADSIATRPKEEQ